MIDNGSVEAVDAPTARAARAGACGCIRDDRQFNYSALHNAAVPAAAATCCALLNDDTEVVDGGWLAAMVAQLLQPGVGAVGAKLVYPDGRIQHAGVAARAQRPGRPRRAVQRARRPGVLRARRAGREFQA